MNPFCAAIIKDGHPVHHYADLDYSYTQEDHLPPALQDPRIVHTAYEKLFVEAFLEILGRPPIAPVRFLHLQASYPPSRCGEKGKFSAHIHCVSEGFSDLRVLSKFGMVSVLLRVLEYLYLDLR